MRAVFSRPSDSSRASFSTSPPPCCAPFHNDGEPFVPSSSLFSLALLFLFKLNEFFYLLLFLETRFLGGSMGSERRGAKIRSWWWWWREKETYSRLLLYHGFFLFFFPLTINQKTSKEPEKLKKKTLTRLEMEKKSWSEKRIFKNRFLENDSNRTGSSWGEGDRERSIPYRW